MSLAADIRAGGAYVELRLKDNLFVRGLRDAERKLYSASDAMSKAGSKVMKVGLAASLPFGLSLKIFADFDDRMRRVSAVTGAVGEEFNALTSLAKQLGRSTSYTASEVADAMILLGQAGLKTNEIMAATGPLLNIARAGALDLASATDIALSTTTGFGLAYERIGYVGDVLAKTANMSNVNVTDLGESLKYASSVARSAGQDLDEVAVALAVLAQNGIRGTLAGTDLKNMMTDLAKNSLILGVSTTNADGTIRNMTDVMIDLGKATRGMTESQRLSKIFDVFGDRSSKSVLALMNSVDMIGQFKTEIEGAAGSSEAAAKLMDAGIGGAFRRLYSSVEGVTIAVGEAMAPAISSLADRLTPIMTGLADWVDQNQSLVSTAAIAAASIVGLGTSLIAGGYAAWGMAAACAMLIKPFTLLGTFAGIAGNVLAVIVPYLWAMMTPTTLLVVAIASLVFVLREFLTLSNLMYVFQAAVSTVTGAAAAGFRMVSDVATAAMSLVVDSVTTGSSFMIQAWQGVLSFLRGVWKSEVVQWLTFPFRTAIGMASGMVSLIGSAFSLVGDIIMTVLGPPLSWLAARVGDVTGFIGSVLSDMAGLARYAMGEFANVIGFYAGVAVKFLAGLGKEYRAFLGYIVSKVPVLRTIVNTIATVYSTLLSGLMTVVSSAYSFITSAASGSVTLISAIAARVVASWQWVGTALTAIFSGLTQLIFGAFSYLGEALSDLATSVSGLVAWISSEFSRLSGVVGTVFNDVIAAFTSGEIELAAQLLWAGVKMIWMEATGGLSNLLNSWWGFFTLAWTEGWLNLVDIVVRAGFLIQKAWADISKGVSDLWSSMTGTLAEGLIRATATVQGLSAQETQAIVDESNGITAQTKDEAQRQYDASIRELESGRSQLLSGIDVQRSEAQDRYANEEQARMNNQTAEVMRLRQEYEALRDAKNYTFVGPKQDPKNTPGAAPNLGNLGNMMFALASGSGATATFRASEVGGLAAGSPLAKIADNTKATAEHTKKMANKPPQGFK